MAKTTITKKTTLSALKKEMKKAGLKMPHGYEIKKRTKKT